MKSQRQATGDGSLPQIDWRRTTQRFPRRNFPSIGTPNVRSDMAGRSFSPSLTYSANVFGVGGAGSNQGLTTTDTDTH
jgi:hypothetical protein